jgi:hypothetical protein
MDALTDAVRAALNTSPFPLKALAGAAQVPYDTLRGIAAGDLPASVEVGEALVSVFDSWGKHCGRHEVAIAQAIGNARVCP